jgi:hypothetical protein
MGRARNAARDILQKCVQTVTHWQKLVIEGWYIWSLGKYSETRCCLMFHASARFAGVKRHPHIDTSIFLAKLTGFQIAGKSQIAPHCCGRWHKKVEDYLAGINSDDPKQGEAKKSSTWLSHTRWTAQCPYSTRWVTGVRTLDKRRQNIETPGRRYAY